MRLAISLATAATVLFANGANPDAIKPIKDFTPPPPDPDLVVRAPGRAVFVSFHANF